MYLEESQATIKNQSVRESLSIALLDRFVSEARQRGADFYALDVPWRVDRVTFTSSFPEVSSLCSRIYSPIEDFAMRRGEVMYWEDGFGHFTPLGNSIVGQGLAKRIMPLCSQTVSVGISDPRG